MTSCLMHCIRYVQIIADIEIYDDRKDAAVPAHQALWLQTNISTGRKTGYQLEETARSSQENMDLSDSR